MVALIKPAGLDNPQPKMPMRRQGTHPSKSSDFGMKQGCAAPKLARDKGSSRLV
jgi:hypothetical protein